MPARLRHLFWNADPSRLDLDAHGGYVAERLLSSGDLDGLAWGIRALTRDDWERAARNRGLPAQQRALARNAARAAGTLNGLFGETRVQFLQCGLVGPERRLEPTTQVAGLEVAGLGDLLAMKLNAVAGRAQLRDYYDLMAIERQTGRSVEEGLSLYLARYRPAHPDSALTPILLALGYLDDVADDPFLPVERDAIADYWQRRQPQIVAAVERHGIMGPPGFEPPCK